MKKVNGDSRSVRRRSKTARVLTLSIFKKRLRTLTRQAGFWSITLWGHTLMGVGTAALYYFEHGVNPAFGSWLDAVFWSIATFTTVGYGDVPVTPQGKVIGIFMMILGSLFMVTYTALLASVLVSPEIQAFEKEVMELEKDVLELAEQEKRGVAALKQTDTR